MKLQAEVVDHTEEYKGHKILVYKQPYRGGRRESFFVLEKDKEEVFKFYASMSDTQASVKHYDLEHLHKSIVEFGIQKAKQLIDTVGYQPGSELRYWVNE